MYRYHSLYVGSARVADPLSMSEFIQALTEEKQVPFDLIKEGGNPIDTECIIHGTFVTFHAEPRATNVIRAEVIFDESRMPPGLRGGRHNIEISGGGLCAIPESMIES